MPESPDALLESLVGRIADDFTRRHQRGEGPRLDEYTQRYPELAELLREILPAIQALSPSRAQVLEETPRAGETHGESFVVPPSGGSPAKAGTTNHLADYEILAEIGRGGMGVVYKARHRTLGRIVALKVLRSDDAADLARFRKEAQAVARLQHPNIVQIFEVQETEGRPFLALEYVEGGSLAERIKGEPQPPRQAAALVETLARAMAAAHERGLVHRDLKPSNVLLASGGREPPDDGAPPDDREPSGGSRPPLASCVPKITDFGLAKRLDQDLGQTQSGAIVGTPSYMAPEQAVDGGNVGPAADIFALGAILYELIAGRPPFKGPSVLETLELVRHAEPTPPSQLQPGCPRDLETICLKCLQKEPSRRYASAAQLVDDLGRFLSHEPIHARPVGTVERLGKWLRRRPAVAASLALAALAALALVTLTVRLLYSWELEDANWKLGEAVGAKETALGATQEAQRIAEKNHQEADDARRKLDTVLERERALHYIHSISLAQREWQANRIDEARRLLDACPADLRHWEWHYLHRQCHVELVTIRGQGIQVRALAVSPDGKLIAAPSFALLRVWDAATGKLALELAGHQQGIIGIAFSPDGARLASVSYDETIRLWDVRTGQELAKVSVTARFDRVAFSADGRRLAASTGSEIHIVETATGAELLTLAGHSKSVQALAFSGDGARLVSGGGDGLIKLWDLRAGKEIFSSQGHTGLIQSVAFSPKQDQIVSCGLVRSAGTVRGEVRLWNAHDGKERPLTLTFPFAVNAAAFSADAAQLACAAGDGSVLFLNTKTGQTSFTLRGDAEPVHQLLLTPDGTQLVSGSADGAIRVWPVQNPELVQAPQRLPMMTALASSADGSRVAVGSYDLGVIPLRGRSQVLVMSAPPAKDTKGFRRPQAVLALAFSPGNHWLAAAELNAVCLLDDTGRARAHVDEIGVVDLSFSPDGARLATATHDPAVDGLPSVNSRMRLIAPKIKVPPLQPVPAIKIWRVADGQLEHVLPGRLSVAYGPDGQRVAGACGRSVKLWDVASGKELATFSGPTEPVIKVQFVAAGRQIVGFTRHQATFWETDTGRIIATVDGLNGMAYATPDGQRIVSRQHGLLKWWDVRLGREMLFLAIPERGLDFGQFVLSADGQHLAAAGGNKLMLWHAAPP